MSITREEALHILDLDAAFAPDQVEIALNQRRAQIEQRIASAPTEALKDKYLRQLQELDEAKAALIGSSGAQTGSPLSQTMLYDLPLANASYTRVDGSQPSPNPGVLLQPGQTLSNGRYQIEEQIGSGGMGAVYRAFDKNRDKDIAIKVLLPSLVSHGKAKERFLQEARLSSEMSHPNIVTVFDVQQDGAHTFLTMELLKGQTLRQYLNTLKQLRKTMTVDEALKIINHVCQGLAYAHDKGAVHRDIKPENIWLTETGQAKVMDFGIARLISTTQMTQTQMAIGTAYYMAPEQLQGLADIDGRADQYAVAIMLYEMLTGNVPTGRIKSLYQLDKHIGKALSHAVDKALDAQRNERFISIADFNAALRGTHKILLNPMLVKWGGIGLAALLLLGIVIATWPHWKQLLPDKEAELAAQTEAARLEGEVKALFKQFQDGYRAVKTQTSTLKNEQERLQTQLSTAKADQRDSADDRLSAVERQLRLQTQLSDRYDAQAEGEQGLTYIEGQLNAAQSQQKAKQNQHAVQLYSALKQHLQSALLRVEGKPDPSNQDPNTFHGLAPGQIFKDCEDCPEMVVIPAGKFVMGSPADEQNRSKDEGPQHEVMIEKIFALGQYEVTRGEFAAFVRGSGHKQPNDCISFTKEGEIKNDANWMNPSYSQTDIHPVVCVSAEDADAYAHWLSQKTGKRYRLPTEAEWEYAERAGNQSLYPWGTDPDSACQYGNVLDQSVKQPLAKLHKKFNTQDSMLFNCNDQHVFTAPVGSYQANAFGLWDVSGNVLEWNCSAYTEGGYDGHEKSCTDDINTRLVRRGGSWLHEPNGVRSALRDGETPSFRHFVLGFRLAQDL